MNLVDFHLHTNFSSDSVAKPESIVDSAISLGLKHICITDHNDFDYPLEDGKIVFDLDIDKYFPVILQLQERYAKQLRINIGVEQGLTTVNPERIENYAAKYNDIIDFIIGSSHMVYGIDPYFKDYWDGRTMNQGVETYLTSIIENIDCCSNFDVYGHIDYIIRYLPRELGDYNYRTHLEMYETILKKLINKGKGIELNSSGFKYGLNQPHPRLELIKFYRELGGEIITIGSDAHAPQHVGIGFDKVPEILEAAGFRYFTVFNKRKPEFIKL